MRFSVGCSGHRRASRRDRKDGLDALLAQGAILGVDALELGSPLVADADLVRRLADRLALAIGQFAIRAARIGS
jgi:hypothetical protein